MEELYLRGVMLKSAFSLSSLLTKSATFSLVLDNSFCLVSLKKSHKGGNGACFKGFTVLILTKRDVPYQKTINFILVPIVTLDG